MPTKKPSTGSSVVYNADGKPRVDPVRRTEHATFREEGCPFHEARERKRKAKGQSSTPDGPEVVCGIFTVRERRDDANTRTIDLAVAIVKSTSPTPAPDPVIYLEGGPGGSALARVEFWTSPPSPLLAERDVILIDQRGTGYSRPRLGCSRRGTGDAKLDAESCWRNNVPAGIDPDAYNSGESASDVSELREVLGLNEVNLFGVSYGTRLALRVMTDHPQGVRSVIIDSVYPPDVEALNDQPRNGANAIKLLLERCRTDDACNRAFPDLQARFFAAVNRLDSAPARVEVKDPSTGQVFTGRVNGGALVQISFDILYSTSSLPSLPHALDLVAKGDVQGAVDILVDPPSARETEEESPDDPPPSDRRPNSSDGLFLSVQCAEETPRNSEGEVNARSASIEDPLRRGLVPVTNRLFPSCQGWPVTPKPGPVTTSDIPTLVLAGALDPITPPAWAEKAASTLSRATYRLFPHAGHGVINAGACARKTVADFVQNPTAPVQECPPEPIRWDLG